MTLLGEIERSRELGMSWMGIAAVVWLVAWPLLPMAVMAVGLAAAKIAERRKAGVVRYGKMGVR